MKIQIVKKASAVSDPPPSSICPWVVDVPPEKPRK
jgi:hypothetical protein